MLFFFILAIIDCQFIVFIIFSFWFENGFWFIKFYLFCLSILLSLFIFEGYLSNVIMYLGWIGSFIVMVIQFVLIIDLVKILNVYWVERMELLIRLNAWYFFMFFLIFLFYILLLAFVVYFYVIYVFSKDCRINLIFIILVVLLIVVVLFLFIYFKVREIGLFQVGIVTSYFIYFVWTCMLYYLYFVCNSIWNLLIVIEFNFYL